MSANDAVRAALASAASAAAEAEAFHAALRRQFCEDNDIAFASLDPSPELDAMLRRMFCAQNNMARRV